MEISKMAIFQQFLDVFSAQVDLINLLVFCMLSGILRHKFRVPTMGILEYFIFEFLGVLLKKFTWWFL